jgi:LuxR family maltose regulon positive regulatory protein
MLTELIATAQRHRAVHLILCSSGRHAVEDLAAGRVDSRVVPPHELLLTLDEIGQLGEVMAAPVDVAAARRLRAALGGWLAPVRLALSSGSVDARPALAAAREYVRASVVLAIGDQGALCHAMRLSLANRLDTLMVHDLGDKPDPYRGLAVLEGAGLLSRRYDGDRIVLSFPSLIRDNLRSSYTAGYPEDARRFHRRLAAWFDTNERAGDAIYAFTHAVARQDWALARRVWQQRSATLGMEYPALLYEALRSMPVAVLEDSPGWRVALDATRAVLTADDTGEDGRQATLLGYLNASRQAVSRGLDFLPLHDLLYIGTGYCVDLRAVSYRASEAFAEQLHELVAHRLDHGELGGDRLEWYWLQRGVNHTVLGDDVTAITHYRRAWRACTPATAPYIAANISANMAMTYAIQGKRRASEHWLARYAAFDTANTWGHHLVEVGARVAAGILALDRFDRATAQAELTALGDGSSPIALWPMVCYLQAQQALHFGDPEAALATLNAAARTIEGAHTTEAADHPLLARARAALLTAAGHGQQAGHLLRTSGSMEPATVVALARAELLGGRYAGARATLTNLDRDRPIYPRTRLALQLIDATAALHLADCDVAARRMSQALDTYGDTGVLRAFAGIPSVDLAELLSLAGRRLSDEDAALLAGARTVYPHTQPIVALTRRERSLVLALQNSQSRQEIATELYLSLNTVKSQIASLYRKLGASTRAEALMKLRQLGLLP